MRVYSWMYQDTWGGRAEVRIFLVWGGYFPGVIWVGCLQCQSSDAAFVFTRHFGGCGLQRAANTNKETLVKSTTKKHLLVRTEAIKHFHQKQHTHLALIFVKKALTMAALVYEAARANSNQQHERTNNSDTEMVTLLYGMSRTYTLSSKNCEKTIQKS